MNVQWNGCGYLHFKLVYICMLVYIKEITLTIQMHSLIFPKTNIWQELKCLVDFACSSQEYIWNIRIVVSHGAHCGRLNGPLVSHHIIISCYQSHSNTAHLKGCIHTQLHPCVKI